MAPSPVTFSSACRLGMVETYSYLPGTNRLVGVYGEGGTDSFQYDAAGNRTSGGGKQFEYDPEGRLERCYEEGALAGEYTYNGFGQRVAKSVEGVTTLFVYDQDGRLILETDADVEGAGREYLHRGDNRLAMYDMAGDAWYFFQNDPIGTPVAVTDEENRIVWEAVYLPCGEAAVNPASLIEFNLRFVGQYFDAETGLHYNFHRYYDPATGRYLTPDPIGLEGGANLYAYVGNNPVNFIDPYGLSKWYPVPGKKGWEVRRDKPLNPDIDYYHEHYRYKGKKIPRKINSETKEQKKHGEGSCEGPDNDVPKDVIDAANKGFSFTGNIGIDLTILEGLETFVDALEQIDSYIPEPPVLPIPGAAPVPVLVFP